MPIADEYRLMIDPELVLPAEGNELDIAFWQRMVQFVDDFGDLIVFGPFAKMDFNDFMLEWFDLAYEAITQSYGNPDMVYLWAEMEKIEALGEASGSWRHIDIGEEVYAPKLGRSTNSALLEADVNYAHHSSVLTDYQVWHVASDSVMDEIGNITIVNVNSNPVNYARALLSSHPSYSAIETLSSIAFPKVLFCKETWTHIPKISSQENEYSSKILACLTALNDSAPKIWKDASQTYDRKTQLDARGAGIDCSPEKPNTMNIEHCKRDRTFHFVVDRREIPILMSWHDKFRRYTGRMYFKVDADNDRVYIGLITTHLSTK